MFQQPMLKHVRWLRRAAALSAGMLVVGTVVAAGRPSTVDQTILDRDRNNRLEISPGEQHLVRDDLGPALDGRADRRVARLTFVQLTDMHLIDEESPLRVEFADAFGPPLTSAYRPQEGLSPQVLNAMVRQVRGVQGVVSKRTPDLVMTTGDNSDNSQLNETRWFIDLLDGGKLVDPNSGTPGTCGTTDDGHRYDGVRGGAYYEPDGSAAQQDGPGYSPRQSENKAEAQRSSSVRDFAGLFELMNKPFQASGLGIPWYGIFGNHDALIQGNQPRNLAFEAYAVGCLKVTDLSSQAKAQVDALRAGGITGEERAQILRIVTDDMLATVTDPQRSAELARIVPQDLTRRPLKKSEYIQEHFNTTGSPVGHGFTQANIASGQGNYAFSPKPGLRLIVLDSVNEIGLSNGNIDNTQFRWLHDELLSAEANRQLALVFAHHSLRTMNQPPASPFPPGDQGGDPSPLVHFGLGPGNTTSACALTDPAAPPTPDETLRCLFLRHPSVIAFVSGHEHVNRVVPYKRDPSGATGGFWEITTASHIDWPQQSRVIEVVNNRDGTLSIFGTIVDHEAAPKPSSQPPASGDRASGKLLGWLASVSRELSYNDPDSHNGEDGSSDARGTPRDRNVELLIKNPYTK